MEYAHPAVILSVWYGGAWAVVEESYRPERLKSVAEFLFDKPKLPTTREELLLGDRT